MNEEQYQAILVRITTLEERFNDVAIALQRLVSTNQVQQLLTLIQSEIAAVQTEVNALNTRVSSIEEDSYED